MYRLQKEKNINVIFNTLIVLGLFMGIAHLGISFFDMSVSIAYYSKANIPSIAYLISHLLFLYIPLLLVIPNDYTFPKAFILKWVFYGISLCYLLGNTWIIYYWLGNPDGLPFQEFQRENALMFNYMAWNCYSPVNLVFNFICMFLYYLCARNLESGRRTFRTSLGIACGLSIVVPIAFKLFITVDDRLWIAENMFLLASQICTSIAMITLSLSHRLWAQYLWSVARRKV